MRLGLVAVLAVALMSLGCATATGDSDISLDGVVVHSEPVALPPDAELEVTLEDVSLADAPSVTLARTRFRLGGAQPPLEFSLTYPAAAVLPGAVYAVRARVTLGDRLLFITAERNQVDPLDPTPLELRLTPVTPAVPDAPLTETFWELTDVTGQPVRTDGLGAPNLVLDSRDSRFAGSSGVNRLMGGYTVDGDSLTFAEVATTLMAGPPQAMLQEQQITAALGRVRGYRITGDQLTLFDEAATPVLQAVAVALR